MFLNKRPIQAMAALITTFCLTGTAAGSTLSTTVTVEEKYDTNVTVEEKADSKSDLVTTVSGELQLTHEKGVVQTAASYKISSSTYTDNDEFNSINHRLSLSMNALLSKNTSLSISDRLRYTPDASEVEELAAIGIGVRRTDILTNTASAGVSHALTERTSLKAAFADHRIVFQDPALVDTTTDTASLSLGYAASPNTGLSLSYQYGIFSFEQDSGEDNIETHSVSVGADRKLSNSTNAFLSVGETYIRDIEPSRDWIAQAGINTAFPEYVVNASYSRLVSYSGGLTNELNIVNAFTVVLETKPAEPLTFNVKGSYWSESSRPTKALDSSAYTVQVSGSWKYRAWLTFNAGYAHTTQWVEKGSVGTDFDRDSVFVNLTAIPFERRF